MIHHVSIPAQNPQHVADVLAEIMKGRSYPFPGATRDSFVAVGGDEHGTMIEVYPASVRLYPGEKDGPVRSIKDGAADYGPFHFLLSVPSDRETIEKVGAREGWRTRFFPRGSPGEPPAFHVIEFWVENRLMIEVATPDMLPDYVRRVSYEKLDERFARG